MYSAAIKTNELSKVESGINKLRDILSTSKEVNKIIENPAVDRGIKKFYFEKFLKKEGLTGLVSNFITVLAENGRLNLLYKAVESFNEIIKAGKGQIDICVSSAQVHS